MSPDIANCVAMRFADQELDQTALDVFKLFDPLRGPLDILDNVVQLAVGSLPPPKEQILFFRNHICYLILESSAIVPEKNRFADKIQDVATAANLTL